ncbi:linear amide C-N hydrolase [Desulfarculus baarsii]
MKMGKLSLVALVLCQIIACGAVGRAAACTGVSLQAADGAVVYGRTMEWGNYDLGSRVNIVPRGVELIGATPDGKPGHKWSTKLGVVGVDCLGKDLLLDGMNEAGLTVGAFYHPGFAEYGPYGPADAAKTISPSDVTTFILSQFATIEQTRQGMAKVLVAPVVEPTLGFPFPVHFLVTEPSGKAIVIEFLKGKMVIFDNPLGVITNAPSFDWHLTNLRNYINLSPTSLANKKIRGLELTPVGVGSGMIGLPGDFTPPSRFVRAVTFTQTARPTADGPETIYEFFRIMDNFNLPMHAGEGPKDAAQSTRGMRSSTLWTTAYDTKNKVLYYHTQHNRRVRKVEVGAIDFGALKGGPRHIPLDKVKAQDIEDVTPKF